MRRRWHFPPGEFPAAAAPRLSLWRIVHLRRLDLTLAVYGHASLTVKQRLWPKARQALTEAPRKRTYARESFQPRLGQLMDRLRATPHARLGGLNRLF